MTSISDFAVDNDEYGRGTGDRLSQARESAAEMAYEQLAAELHLED